MGEWYEDWFASDQYLNVYKHRDEKDALQLLELISNSISIPKNGLILDAACGAGRYTNLLQRKGYNAIGFDLSLPLLKVALQNSNKNNDKSNYFRADIRRVPLKRRFNLILNIFTSFGYFETDEENFSFIRNSINYLVKDGYFVFDYINKNYLLSSLVPSSQKTIDEFFVEENRRIENNRVVKEIKISSDTETKKFVESVQLYSKEVINDQFLKSGYKLIHSFGDYSGQEFNEATSQRLILIYKNEN